MSRVTYDRAVHGLTSYKWLLIPTLTLFYHRLACPMVYNMEVNFTLMINLLQC